MYQPIQLTSTTPPVRTFIKRSLLRRGFLIPLALVLAGFAFSPMALAADGGLPSRNTAEWDGALSSLTTGFHNTAIGFDALFNNADCPSNTASGYEALFSNTQGEANTASGDSALFHNTTGGFNTATGLEALFSNTTGGGNTANGFNALFNRIKRIDRMSTAVEPRGIIQSKSFWLQLMIPRLRD